LVRKTSKGFRWTGDVRVIEKDLDVPLRWKKPKRIFVNSMSDLFHESLTDFRSAVIRDVFRTMALAHWHTFQILTKRAAGMYHWFKEEQRESGGLTMGDGTLIAFPLPNVWLGVSCENQATANERIPWLLKTPAAVRFISAEPLLEHLDLRKFLHAPQWGIDGMHSNTFCKVCFVNEGLHPKLDLCITGGESGPKARPCNVAWLLGIIDQCQAMDTACFVKQMGSYSVRIDSQDAIEGPVQKRMHWQDRKGADPNEWPAQWRIQQFPEAPHA
jgi:protein gp37